MEGLMRTHNCGELRETNEGNEVILCGWVNKYRNLGGLHFIDVRDKYGITQLSFEEYSGDLETLKNSSLESVIKATGKVRARPEDAINKDMLTGKVEVSVVNFEILSTANKDKLPFLPYGLTSATEDLRLKYRYLDLRTKKLQDILALRSLATLRTRQTLVDEGFIEVETPMLYKSTPEGARDYVVPSRIHSGKVYALPQSPQTLKQLLMIGGTDKYFQIVKCFRDEDLRADRQPEFTQIDVEISFATPKYVKQVVEKILKVLFEVSDDFEIPMMSFQDALTSYGTDKPDLRFGLKQLDVVKVFKESGFSTFAKVAEGKGLIKAMFVPASMGTFSRKEIDAFPKIVAPYGGKGVAWFKVNSTDKSGERSGGISKFITDEMYEELGSLLRATEDKTEYTDCLEGGTWLFLADGDAEVVHASADALRRHLGRQLNLIKEGYEFVWIHSFPLFEWSEEDKRLVARHHPFTMPKANQIEDFMSGDHEKLLACSAEAYDVVCNGYEIAGGSLRIYKEEMQAKMFDALNMTREEAKDQFGFFLEALEYGVPPHAGIAFGLDRVVMLMAKTENIRDVIAFPKTTSATDLMSSAPSVPADGQTKELHFQWRDKE